MDPLGIAYFTNVVAVESASMTITPGIGPSCAVLTIHPQVDTIEEYGDLSFFFGGDSVKFIECKADAGELVRDASGMVWRLTIFDRRWKWRFGQIGGQYNWRKPDGSLRTETEKTPQDLARLCLDAMGEGSWDLSEMPNDSRPAIVWDCDNPAEALASLCDSVGCLVCPNLSERSGRVCLAGSGADLPNGGIESASILCDPPEMPNRIAVVCGPDRWEANFPLEPVGEEYDSYGTVKPIDELSYKPTGGWNTQLPGMFWDDDGEDYSGNRDRALRTVWKWYRIKIPEGGLYVPGCSYQIRTLDQIELEDCIVTMAEDEVSEGQGDGVVTTTTRPRRQKAFVFGIWFNYDHEGEYANNETIVDPEDCDYTKVPWRFSIDFERRMVVFERCVYYNAGNEDDIKPEPPELYLKAACRLLDPDTRAPLRTYKYRDTGGHYNTDMLVLRHDEIVLAHSDASPYGVNIEDVEKECDYYITSEYQKYAPVTGQSATYMGLVRGWIDGAIRQLTYSVGRDGATTTMSRNSEELVRAESYKTRRARQRATEAMKKLEAVRHVSDIPNPREMIA